MSQRLSSHKNYFRTGEIDRALQFAGPALAVVSMESIDFLGFLREKNANRRRCALCRVAGELQQQSASGRQLSLAAFVIHLHAASLHNLQWHRHITSQSASTITPAAVAPELRNAFFQTAAAILLRPLPAARTTRHKLSGY